MKDVRSLVIHFTLLVVATAFAVYVWTRDKTSEARATADVTVWSGRAADVQRIKFENKTRKVLIESKKDAAGRWFEGTSERETAAPTSPDGGTAEPAQKTTVRIVSVKAAEKIAEGLAPLRAVRSIGKVADDKLADFGLKEPQGTLTVTINGQDKSLVLGSTAPGGTDRYAKNEASGEIIAIPGDVVRDIESGEAALNERDLHGFEEMDIQSVKVSAAGKERQILRRGSEGKRYWADPASPDKPDESAVTWLTKLDRLRPMEYVAELPKTGNPSLVVRIEYASKAGYLGYLELQKIVTEGSAKPEYYLRTERTRMFAKVFSNSGEQVEQDVGTVIKDVAAPAKDVAAPAKPQP